MRTIPLLIAAGLLAAPLFAQGKDIVVRKDGARLRGVEITEFNHSSLRATKKGGSVTEIPGHMILSVRFGDLADEFISGRAAMERGDFATATQMFGAAADKATRPLVKADCEFFQIKAAVAAIGGDTGAAGTAADKAKTWLAANTTHWRVPEALLLAGRAYRLAGNPAAASTTLKELDDRASRDGFGPVWAARAKFELAQTFEADGKAAEARTMFQSASSAADNALMSPSTDEGELRTLKVLAKIGEGETYLTEKDFTRAEQFFQGMTTSTEAGMSGAAWAGTGQAIYHKAAEDKNKSDLRRAQIALARASVLDTQGGEASAKANYYLGLLQLALEDGDKFKVRARTYFQLVVANYPSSKWAASAKTALTQ